MYENFQFFDGVAFGITFIFSHRTTLSHRISFTFRLKKPIRTIRVYRHINCNKIQASKCIVIFTYINRACYYCTWQFVNFYISLTFPVHDFNIVLPEMFSEFNFNTVFSLFVLNFDVNSWL